MKAGGQRTALARNRPLEGGGPAMETVAVELAIDPKRVQAALEKARTMLDKASGELILDLTAIPRLAATDLRSLDGLAAVAAEKGVTIVLRGVGSSVYTVLKLMKLSSRFSFAN